MRVELGAGVNRCSKTLTLAIPRGRGYVDARGPFFTLIGTCKLFLFGNVYTDEHIVILFVVKV